MEKLAMRGGRNLDRHGRRIGDKGRDKPPYLTVRLPMLRKRHFYVIGTRAAGLQAR